MSISLGWQGITFPRLKDPNDSVEVGKALLDILGKLNQLSAQFAFLALGEVTLLPEAGGTLLPNPDTAWHEIGAAGQPAFQNSWVNYATGFNTAAFRKDAFGFVHLKGVLAGTTGNTVAFTLPVGYTPSATIIQVAIGDVGNVAVVDFVTIPANGQLAPHNSASTSIDGVVFYAGP